jgi:hypothetical protein
MVYKTRIRYCRIIFACFLMILVSCNSDHGVGPKSINDQEFGFGGNIVFYGVWPDSIKRVFLVVFKDPLEDTNDFGLTNMRYLSIELPLKVSNYNYNTLDSSYIPLIPDEGSLSEYHYVAVAQQSTEVISLQRKDWFVTGIYYTGKDATQPGVLTIPIDSFIDGINIYCDFDNPPPQPPGGE